MKTTYYEVIVCGDDITSIYKITKDGSKMCYEQFQLGSWIKDQDALSHMFDVATSVSRVRYISMDSMPQDIQLLLSNADSNIKSMAKTIAQVVFIILFVLFINVLLIKIGAKAQ